MCNPIKIFFDQLASEWDGMYPPVSGETLDAILDVLHIFPGCQVLDKTTPRLIQFHTLKNAVNPPFLGGFLIFGTVVA